MAAMLFTRARHSLLAVLLGPLACSSPSGTDSDTIDLTVRITLAGNRNVGTTAARIYVFEGVAGVQRASADTRGAQSCALDVTPVTTCTIPVSSGSTVTLIAVESSPAVFVRLEPAAPPDTVPDGDFVEFLGWSSCADLLDRGTCVLAPNGRSIEATYQLMNQVTVYQTGAAAMDYVTIADPAVLPLRIPPENFNILNQAGCRGRLNFGPPCDAVRLIGDEPWHRFTAFVPRGTIVGMFPSDGAATTFLGWTGDCILSGVYGGGVCSLIAPETSGNPIVLTLRYEWWDCPGGPRDNDAGGCVLRQGQGSRVQGTGKD
jgi:hypothetical protein